MKRIFTGLAFSLLLFTAANAQHFVADMQVKEDTLVFKMKAVGNFNARIFEIELFLRWDSSTNVSLSPGVINQSAFPGLGVDYSFNSPYVSDPGYHNVWIYLGGGGFDSHSYTDGTVYELFRTTMTGGVPALIQLVADNDTGDPYYFVTYSFTPDNWDLNPYYPESPFINPTGSSGSFFYKNYVFSNPHSRTSPNRNDASIGAKPAIPASVVTRNRQYLQNRKRPSKITAAGVQINTVPEIKVYPNPVRDHVVSISLPVEGKQTVQVQLEDISGKLIKTYADVIQEGQGQLILQLPASSKGVYYLKINREGTGAVSKMILIL